MTSLSLQRNERNSPKRKVRLCEKYCEGTSSDKTHIRVRELSQIPYLFHYWIVSYDHLAAQSHLLLVEQNLFIHSLWNCRRSFFIVFWQKKSKTSFVNFWCHCYAWNFGKLSENRWITKMFDVNEKYANMQRSLGHGIILSGAARGIVGRKTSQPQTCYNNLNSLNLLPNLIILHYF
jgi:hypothetical protein